jgi:hypothetical protein
MVGYVLRPPPANCAYLRCALVCSALRVAGLGLLSRLRSFAAGAQALSQWVAKASPLVALHFAQRRRLTALKRTAAWQGPAKATKTQHRSQLNGPRAAPGALSLASCLVGKKPPTRQAG